MSKNDSNGSRHRNTLTMSDVEPRFAEKYRFPPVDPLEYEIDAAIIALVSRDLCEQYDVVPISRAGKSLIVAMADPMNQLAIDHLKSHTGCNVERVVATKAAIVEAIAKYYGVLSSA